MPFLYKPLIPAFFKDLKASGTLFYNFYMAQKYLYCHHAKRKPFLREGKGSK